MRILRNVALVCLGVLVFLALGFLPHVNIFSEIDRTFLLAFLRSDDQSAPQQFLYPYYRDVKSGLAALQKKYSPKELEDMLVADNFSRSETSSQTVCGSSPEVHYSKVLMVHPVLYVLPLGSEDLTVARRVGETDFCGAWILRTVL